MRRLHRYPHKCHVPWKLSCERTEPRGRTVPHEGTGGSDEFSGSCYCHIFRPEIFVIVHREVFTLCRINTGVSDWIKSGWGGERYHNGGFRFPGTIPERVPICPIQGGDRFRGTVMRSLISESIDSDELFRHWPTGAT